MPSIQPVVCEAASSFGIVSIPSDFALFWQLLKLGAGTSVFCSMMLDVFAGGARSPELPEELRMYPPA
jgi:hypothetical protein